MKKILLLSDTHHYIDEKILLYCAEADEIWHAGDIGSAVVADRISSLKPLKAVWGNIDDDKMRRRFEETLVFNCEGVKIMIIHIGGTPGKKKKKVKSAIHLHQPDVFICGHSHILKIQRDPNFPMLYINPGAAGQIGFHQVRTMVRFTIQGNEIGNMEVIELGKRGRLS